MADEKKIIDVEVREKGLDELNADLQKTEQSFKDVDKAADKTSKSVDDVAGNGGAIAILDSLTGGLATRMRDAYEASKLLNFSLKGMKTALIATGIGAFVVALGLIVAYWDDIVELIGGANKQLQIQIDKANDIADQTTVELELLKAKESLLRKQGKSTKENLELQKELTARQILDNEVQLERLKTQLEIESSKAAELSIIDKILIARGVAIGSAISEEEFAELKARKDAIDELTIATVKLKEAQFDLENPEQAEGEGTRGADQESAEALDPIGIVSGLPIGDLKDFIDVEAGIINAARKENLKQQVRNSNASVRIAEEEFFAKQELLFASADGLMAMGDLIGRQTGEGKALAVAGALINTYASIAGQLKAFAGVPIPGYAIAQAIATGLVGFAAVKNILSVQVPQSNISNPVVNTGGSISAPAPPSIRQPDFNLVGQSGINQLADVIAEQERKPQRAYVVSEDIETNAELDRRIESSAAIG